MMQPVGFLVVVKPEPIEEALKVDKIILPDEVKDKQRIHLDRGTLVAVGNKAWKDLADGGPWAKVGDKVYYAKMGGKIYIENDEMFVLLQDRDILGVFND